MVDFFANSLALSGIILVLVGVMLFLVSAGILFSRWAYRVKPLGYSLPLAILVGLALSTAGVLSTNEAKDRDLQEDYVTYHQKISENCDGDTVKKYEQIARSFEGARDAPSGPKGAYQALWTGGCQYKD